MAFAQSLLYKSGAIGARPAITIYVYTAHEELSSAVVAPGYFARNPRFTFHPGDIIYAACQDGYKTLEVQADTTSAAFARQAIGDAVLIKAESAMAAQEPTGLDAPLVLDFGGPVGIDSDKIQILANQHIRANIDLPDLRARIRLQVGRVGNPGQAHLFIRTVADGFQPFSSLYIELDDATQSQPMYITAWFSMTAGQEMWFEMVRDSAGIDAGGLYAQNPTLAGWNDATTTFLQISEAVVQ